MVAGEMSLDIIGQCNNFQYNYYNLQMLERFCDTYCYQTDMDIEIIIKFYQTIF